MKFPIRLGLLLACVCLTGSAAAQFGQQAASEDMILLAPRALMRMLREGETAIAEGRYTDAVNALGALISDDYDGLPEDLRGQDFFVETGIQGLYQKSVKGEAIRLLSSLPAEGRKTMEIQFGATARLALDSAIQDRDFASIGEVARKFVHTDAGYDAQVLIAQYNLTRGYPLAAAGTLQNLLEYPAARERFGAQLAYATSIALLQAGNRELAVATLRLAVRDFPGASLMVGGQQIAVAATTDWATILERQSKTLPSIDPTPDAWLTAGGAPSRSAFSDAGMPLPNRRWEKEIHSSVLEREALLDVEELAQKSGNVILPKFELRMIDDTIIAKTTDGGVVGIDFKTGNTQWERYFGSSAAPLKGISWGNRYSNEDAVSRELQDRVWGSSAFGRLSCDAERFYFVSREGEEPLNPRTIFNGSIIARDSNYLEGVSIAQQGAILWRVGGADGQDEAALAGAYFLGPPLAYEGHLYCLLETNGEMKLAVLDPTNGRLLWMQQLIQASMLPIRFDEGRQAQALSPTISDGVILCPTGAGAVVAVDLLTRSLRWGLVYRPQARNAQNFGAFNVGAVEYMPLEARWEDPGMIAQHGIVICSPPDFDKLFCRDILTGAPVKTHPRRSARYIAGLRGNNLILVSETGVTAVPLRDNVLSWEMDFPAGLKLAGKGLWQRDSILVPLTERTLIRVSLEDGSIIEQTKVDQDLGNLFAYRQQLLSVNATSISAYYTRESLSDVEQRLAADPQDTWAMNRRAQLLADDGDLDRALDLLQRAFEIKPNDADTRFLMVDTLLDGLELDFDKYDELADKLDQVVELGPQRFRYLQQLALGKMRSGEHLAAFQRLFQLMQYQLEMSDKSQGRSSELRLSSRYRVDSDAWIATQLARTYQAATPAEQQQMLTMINKTLGDVDGTMVPLRRSRLRYLAWLQPVSPYLLDLAKEIRNSDSSEQTIAEQLVQPILHVGEPASVAAATELLQTPAADDLKFLGPAGRSYDDAMYGLPSGMRAIAPAPPNQQTKNVIPPQPIEPIVWNHGRADYTVNKDFALYMLGRKLEVVGERYGRPNVSVALSNSLLVISNENGETIAPLSFNPASSDANNLYARVHMRGGLLLLETGSEVAAFDLYSGFNDQREALLWRHSLVSASPENVYQQVQSSASSLVLGITLQHRQTDSQRQAVVGPLTPASLVIQSGTTVAGLDILNGRRLWEREGYGNDLRFAADGLEVAIVNPAEGKVEVIDCRDGALIREREFRGDWSNWFSHAGMLVDYRQAESKTKIDLRIWNALTGEVFKELSVSLTARAGACQRRFMVVVEPGRNELHYFDLHDLVYRQSQVPIDRELTRINVERFQDRIVVLSVRGGRDLENEVIEHAVNGSVYAIDQHSGALAWDRPGRIHNMRFPLNQPRHSPFMVVQNIAKSNNNDQPSLAALALVDLRDGHLAFADDAIVVRSQGSGMQLKPTQQSLALAIGDKNYQFRFTNEDRPPQPVVDFGAK
ncbi:MAG: PQQ-binding-like beta-propeller repeat protein [Pirellulaceae bacterium]